MQQISRSLSRSMQKRLVGYDFYLAVKACSQDYLNQNLILARIFHPIVSEVFLKSQAILLTSILEAFAHITNNPKNSSNSSLTLWTDLILAIVFNFLSRALSRITLDAKVISALDNNIRSAIAIR